MSLVLLPGLDGTGSLLRPLLDELGDMQARVIAYPTAQALNLGELSALVLRQLPAKKAVLVAESFSGLVALSLLTSAATRVSGIIFVGAFAEPPRPLLLRLSPLVSHSPNLLRSAPAFLLRQFCLGAEATTNDLNSLREALAAVSPAVLAQRLALVAGRHSFGKAFDIPCSYLRARHDRLVPEHAVKWFISRFRNFELVEVDGPHFLLMMKPEEAARVIRQKARRMAGLG